MIHVNDDHDLAQTVAKNCQLEERGTAGSQECGHSHPAREKANKVGSIKLTSRLLTSRPFPALFEVTGMRDA